jgi:hypothetical protein
MIGVDKTGDELERIQQQARETGNELALDALEMVRTVLMGRHALNMHIEKERGLRLQYHGALTRALGWTASAKPKGKKKTITKTELEEVLSLVRVEILTGLGELSDFEVTA